MSEERDKLDLTRWLFSNGFFVYWEHKNIYGYPTFNVKGMREKPDLLIRRKENPNWFVTAIEVKQPNGADVRDGSKILRYWQNYVGCKTTYHIGEEQVYPKYFLVGTRCSMSGRLFESDTNIKPINDNGRIRAIEMGMIPCNEFTETFGYVRQLWVNWRDVFARREGTGLGVLLSSVLDDDGCRPGFMYEGYNSMNNRWRQYWRTFQ